jgi:glyceraldehyde 3-phosphate dehydrogenase
MKKIKVAVNGFGRIGRLVTRIFIEKYSEIVEVIAVNDLTSIENLAYLFEYDTVYRKFGREMTIKDNSFAIENYGEIAVLCEKDAALLPWRELGIDVIVECTGRNLTIETATAHIKNGHEVVILSAPAKDDEIETFVCGVRELTNEIIDKIETKIMSNASCTTNCLAPFLNVINNANPIKSIAGITVHAMTASQSLQDSPNQKDPREGRSAVYNTIPSTTGASKAVKKVIPDITDVFSFSSVRVPVLTGSMIDLHLELKENITVADVVKLFETVINQLDNKLIFQLSYAELVSSDVIGSPYSCIIDVKSLKILDSNRLNVTLWYDNEWGYANRLADIVSKIAPCEGAPQ